jgi:hypothetical protein
MPGSEVLLVGYAAELAALRRWPVAAQVDPDVVVVRADVDDLEEIAPHARLAMGRLPDGAVKMVGDERVLDDLDEGARLFVRAWQERPLRKAERRGEGLSWDAPGFEPPDR